MTALQAFEAERPRLARLAYRMLGSVSEAEDVVQDAWLRWSGEPDGSVRDPAAWLVRVATRLCLDRIRAAKARREAYRGPWLPEPLIEPLAEDPLERAEDVSVAFLLALERLSPLERAALLLHDVFDADYAVIAQTLQRSEAACRQLTARARAHVRQARPRYNVSETEVVRLATAFMAAAQQGDFSALSNLLAEDAVMISDGGGKRAAALRPLVGQAEIMTLIRGVAARNPDWASAPMRLARVNGYIGAIMEADDGVMTYAFEPSADGRLAGVYVMRNPDKLRHVTV